LPAITIAFVLCRGGLGKAGKKKGTESRQEIELQTMKP